LRRTPRLQKVRSHSQAPVAAIGKPGEGIMNEDPILKAWQKYQHLDKLLSDRKWVMGDTVSPQRMCLYDLWMSIREAVKG
jgi:hypothetical protein